MSATRFYTPQDGHVVMALPPQNLSGGLSSAAVNFTKYTHLSALILFGALSAAPGLITVQACTSQAGAGAVNIPFNLFAQETTGGDVFGPIVNVPATGYQPPDTPNINYAIEIDSAQIPTSPTTGSWEGYNYIRVSIADGTDTDFVAIVFVLSGARYAVDQSPTVLV
jgi:hypothetical protein